jgi:hypothetical protein
MNVTIRACAWICVLGVGTWAPPAASDLPRLRVSENGRFLVTEGDQPFFWLGDTAWRMINRASRVKTENQPSVLRYLDTRAAQGFNVIQTVVVGFGGKVNAAGHKAFVDGDWAKAQVVLGPENDYWDDVDWLIDQAAERGLYLALLPFWLNTLPLTSPMDKDPRVAYRYGHFLGSRYGDRGSVIWVLGGDAGWQNRNVDNPARLALIRMLAEGIADGANGQDRPDGNADWSTTLMTFHPPGRGRSSSLWVHQEPWLDFNLIQTTTMFSFANYETVASDYQKKPARPTLDAEVAYEDSLSLNKSEPQDRRITPWDVRRAAYWSVFAGAFGHTYGHRSNIQWIRRGEKAVFGAHIPWCQALDAPGAKQMTHLTQLMESLPFLTRIPDQSVIVGDPGEGLDHGQATRDAKGTYAMVYLPTGKPVTVRLDVLRSDNAKAAWFDPRSGTVQNLGELPVAGTHRFTPPSTGPGHDWVLILHDGSMKVQI